MRRFSRLIALLPALVASACVSFPDAPDALAPPALAANVIQSIDGALLPLKVWPAENPRAVILAVHGMNDYSNAFVMPATWWAENAALTTYAYDQRGFGASAFFGRWFGAATMKSDLRAAFAAIRAAHPGLPIYVLGHSMGAAVVMATDAEEPLGADGLILAAPGVWGGGALPLTHRLAANLAATFAPAATLTGERAHRQSTDNIEVLRAMGADPKVIKETRTDAVLGVVRVMGEAFDHANDVCSDALILVGRKDEVIPSSAVEYVAENLCGPASVRRYPDGWHLILRDLQRERVFRDVAAWINANEKAPRTGGL